MVKIGVIGLGLIGGSIFKDLIRLGYDCIGISQSQKGLDGVYGDYSYLKDRELVFVCKEMRKTLLVLDEIEPYLSENTVVTDVCSLKEFLAKKKYKYNFIPSHPMAGTEFSGWENSKEGLFKGAKWVITPIDEKHSTGRLEEVIKNLGAEIIYTDPKEHDEAAALISHMPLVIAQALFQTARENKLAMKLASSGFRDMTRLALSSVDMAEDMVKGNSSNIERAILRLYEETGKLLKNNYSETARMIKTAREEMYLNGTNVFDNAREFL